MEYVAGKFDLIILFLGSLLQLFGAPVWTSDWWSRSGAPKVWSWHLGLAMLTSLANFETVKNTILLCLHRLHNVLSNECFQLSTLQTPLKLLIGQIELLRQNKKLSRSSQYHSGPPWVIVIWYFWISFDYKVVSCHDPDKSGYWTLPLLTSTLDNLLFCEIYEWHVN